MTYNRFSYFEEEIVDQEATNGPVNIPLMLQKLFRIRNQHLREFLAEMFATLFLVACITGSIAQGFITSQLPMLLTYASCGFGCAISGLIFGKVSGGHMNPAVSLVMFLTGKMTVLRMLIYWLAQFIGAFLAALVIYISYYEVIQTNGKTMATAGIFATYPSSEKVGWAECFLEQVVGTAFLIISILAITDKKNQVHSNTVSFLLVAIVLFVQGAAFSGNCGGAINPARDLSPRLFTLLAGWGDEVFSAGNFFFWIPIAGPFCGAIIGMVFYAVFVGNNWP